MIIIDIPTTFIFSLHTSFTLIQDSAVCIELLGALCTPLKNIGGAQAPLAPPSYAYVKYMYSLHVHTTTELMLIQPCTFYYNHALLCTFCFFSSGADGCNNKPKTHQQDTSHCCNLRITRMGQSSWEERTLPCEGHSLRARTRWDAPLQDSDYC